MSENENNFETLRRLLALKRHEIPPPGYFEDFSNQVIARIHAGQNRGSFAEKIFERAPWFLKLLQTIETKQVYSGGFAAALCLVLLFGIVYVNRSELDSAQQPFLQPTAQNTSPFTTVASANPALPQLASQPLMAMDNTNPIIGLPANALFSQSQPMFQQVGFSQSGN